MASRRDRYIYSHHGPEQRRLASTSENLSTETQRLASLYQQKLAALAVNAISIDPAPFADDMVHESAKHALAQRRKYGRWLDSEDPVTVVNAMHLIIGRALNPCAGENPRKGSSGDARHTRTAKEPSRSDGRDDFIDGVDAIDRIVNPVDPVDKGPTPRHAMNEDGFKLIFQTCLPWCLGGENPPDCPFLQTGVCGRNANKVVVPYQRPSAGHELNESDSCALQRNARATLKGRWWRVSIWR